MRRVELEIGMEFVNDRRHAIYRSVDEQVGIATQRKLLMFLSEDREGIRIEFGLMEFIEQILSKNIFQVYTKIDNLLSSTQIAIKVFKGQATLEETGELIWDTFYRTKRRFAIQFRMPRLFEAVRKQIEEVPGKVQREAFFLKAVFLDDPTMRRL